jgi:hypothetical protein
VLFRLAPLPEDAPGSITELVVQLDRRGNAIAAKIQPRDRSKRIIDLPIGDDLLFDREWRTITAVSSFSDNWLTEKWAADKLKRPDGDGYLSVRLQSESAAGMLSSRSDSSHTPIKDIDGSAFPRASTAAPTE